MLINQTESIFHLTFASLFSFFLKNHSDSNLIRYQHVIGMCIMYKRINGSCLKWIICKIMSSIVFVAICSRTKYHTSSQMPFITFPSWRTCKFSISCLSHKFSFHPNCHLKFTFFSLCTLYSNGSMYIWLSMFSEFWKTTVYKKYFLKHSML